MNTLTIYTLKLLRRIYSNINKHSYNHCPSCELNPDKASHLIYDLLVHENGCMIARLGSTELNAVINYVGVTRNETKIISYIRGKSLGWWWNNKIINQMQEWSGFFPPTIDNIIHFSEMLLLDMEEVDILGSWIPEECFFEEKFKKASKINIELLNPFFTTSPWTKALENRKILVIHPFASQIESQYKKRKLLFQNEYILPEFKLETIQAVQSLGGDCSDFDTWFDALEFMKAEIDKRDYDICLIGCGAYGFPLAAHVKRTGKKAVHLGGSLQLLFGIKGKRWENPDYNPIYNYAALMNEHWVYPDESTKPKNANQVEGACYW